MGDVVVFGALVVIVAVVGIWIGILVAPRLGRLADAADEETGDDDG